MKYQAPQSTSEITEFVVTKADTFTRFGIYMVNIDIKKIRQLSYEEWPWCAYPRGEAFTYGSATARSNADNHRFADVNIGPKNTDIKINKPTYHYVSNLVKPFSEEGIPLKITEISR